MAEETVPFTPREGDIAHLVAAGLKPEEAVADVVVQEVKDPTSSATPAKPKIVFDEPHVSEKEPQTRFQSGIQPEQRASTASEEDDYVAPLPEKKSPKKTYFEANGNRFTIDANIVDEIPNDVLSDMLRGSADGTINFSSVVKVAQEKAKKAGQVTFMRRVLAMIIATVLFVVGLNSVATIISLEATKESRVNGSKMVDLQGNVVRVGSTEMGLTDGQLCARDDEGACTSGFVKTGEARSFTTLFELPLFDSKTLASVRELNLQLQDGHELTVTITGNLKKGKAVTFFTASGQKVTIDGNSMTAFANIDGKHYTVESQSRRLRRLKEGLPTPKLYSERDFFTSANGFEVSMENDTPRRRLSAAADVGGWAAVAMAAGDAAVAAAEESGVTIKKFASVRSILHVSKDDKVGEISMSVLHDKTDASRSRVYFKTQSGAARLSVYSSNELFKFADSQLTGCDTLDDTEVPALLADAANLAEEGSLLQQGVDVLGSRVVVEVLEVVPDEIVPELRIPEETGVCYANRRLAEQERRLADPLIDFFLTGWDLCKSAFGFKVAFFGIDVVADRPVPAGWTFTHPQEQACKSSTSFWHDVDSFTEPWLLKQFVKLLKKFNIHVPLGAVDASHAAAQIAYNAAGEYAVIFQDSVDAGDWAVNIGGMFKKEDGNHAGFMEYARALSPCIAERLGGNKLRYVIGHSLGGGAASVYYQQQGGRGSGTLASNADVITYGAPATGSPYCNANPIPGRRFLHESDVVGSDAFGLMSLNEYGHQIEAVSLYVKGSWFPLRWWGGGWSESGWQHNKDCGHKSSDSLIDAAGALEYHLAYHVLPEP